MNKPNLHILEVKYLGATNYRGSRVKVTSLRYGWSRTFEFDSKFNSAIDQGVAWLENVQGLTIIGTAEGVRVNYAITDTFQPFLK